MYAGIWRWRRWINEKIADYYRYLDLCSFHCIIDLGAYATGYHQANATHLPGRFAITDTHLASNPADICFVNMNLSSPRRHFIILVASTFLFLTLSSCGGAAMPDTSAPAAPEPTQIPSEAEPATEPPAILIPTVIPTQIIPTTALPAIPERRRLTLEFPPKMRAGDSEVIRLTLEVDDLGNITPTALFDGSVVTGEVVEIPDLYETHNVVAEAKFDIAGMQVSPPELISQTLSKGQSLNFYWSIRTTEIGVYRGTIWFYLRFVDKVSGEESRKTVSAQILEIEAVNFLGLSANLVRTVGGVGSVVGAVIGFPFFEDIIKLVFRRRSRKK